VIILPERNRPVGNALLPMRRSDWIEASRRPSFSPGEHGRRTRWRLRAHHPDDRGRILWEGWISDREAVDAILHSILRGALKFEPELWGEVEEWRSPGGRWKRGDFRPEWFGELVPLLAVATVTFITTTGSGTYTAPADFVSAGSTAEAIGSGGSGGAAKYLGSSFNAAASGGSGGAYALASASSLSAGGTASTVVPTGGASVSTSTDQINGNAGADASFGSLAIAKGGLGGTANSTSGSISANGVSGGAASGSTGSTKNNGGASGTATSTPANSQNATGGGGAGGGTSAGTASAASSSGTLGASSGGQGDGSTGGAGGTGNTGSAGGTGSTGTEWDASHGSGGGGGGSGSSSGGGTGGLYGAGGGAGFASTTGKSGAGAQGILVVTYTPLTTAAFLAIF
jgi:hypothetical protein